MNARTIRVVGRTAAAAMVAASVAALGLAAPGLAHPHQDGEGEKKVEKFIIMSGKHDAKGGPGLPRQFHMLRERGKGGLVGCEGQKTEVDETTTDKGTEKTRIVICHDDKLSSAERAAKLEQSLARIRSDEHLSGEHKAKVEAALSEAIAKLRASK